MLRLSSSFILNMSRTRTSGDPVCDWCSQSAHSSSMWRHAIAGTNSMAGTDPVLSLYILAFQCLCDMSSDRCIVWTTFLHNSAVEDMG